MTADNALAKASERPFTLHEEGGQVIACYTPGPDAIPPTAKDIRQMIVTGAYAACYIDEEAIRALERMMSNATDPVESVVAERRDGEAQINVSRDAMRATMTLSKPMGGRPVAVEDVQERLASAGVVFGIRNDVIEAAVASGRAEDLTVAEGAAPENGQDCRFETLYSEEVEDRPKVDANGRADMHELEHFVFVKTGDPLMKLIPATNGVSGSDVLGRPTPCRPGRNLSFAPKLSGAEIAPDDPNLLIATIGGLPQKVDRGVVVKPLLQVPTVDIATGNIHFEGSVKVSGDVVSGTKVSATGDIFVSGTVESASLIAGGDIQVGQGIIGRGDIRDAEGNLSPNASRVMCRGNLSARFIEKAYVEAEQDITIASLIMHSEVRAGDKLTVGDKHSPKGHIVNGIYKAGKRIEAKVLGSLGEVHTQIEVGTGTIDQDTTENIRKKLSALMQDKKKLFMLIRHLTSEAKPERANMLATAKVRLKEVHEEIKTQVQCYREARTFEQSVTDACVVVHDNAYKGVHLRFCGTSRSLDGEIGGGTFSLRDNRIAFKPRS